MSDINQNLLRRAIAHFGEEAQCLKAAEECAELAAALLQGACRTDASSYDHVEEEIADVEIMLAQLKLIYDHENIASWRWRKLARLEERLGERK